MNASRETISYQQTGYFSKLVNDYLQHEPALQPFYKHAPTIDGIKAAIEARKLFPQNRELLVEALHHQYKGLDAPEPVAQNLRALLHEHTFTVTTAHQPNIFTGPIYFIYKILHAIKLAEWLKSELPQYEFVPVYYMGSEDADLDELGHIFLSGDKVVWRTNQTGAVGRMKTNGLELIINRMQGEFGHLPFAEEMIELCKNAYTNQPNIQQATLFLVNELFKSYGLIVVVPDNALLKSAFIPVVEKELFERFSYPLVHETAAAIAEKYKAQTQGRDINLFYLSDDGNRDRIEYSANGEELWQVVNKDISFSKQAIQKELYEHPERFSGNVILRGIFQETILPNIAFIGGGGELAYWMELKKVFEAVNVPYPVLLLRNSFLLIDETQKALQTKLGVTTHRLFVNELALLNEYTLANAHTTLSTKQQQLAASEIYRQLQEQASAIDTSLKPHVAALHVGVLKGLVNLEKKFLRAEKRHHADYARQLHKLKSVLFPQNSLQERVDNFMPLYANYGKEIISVLYENSQPLTEAFSVLFIDKPLALKRQLQA
jgi:bacillithiol biosynthesis cysteine-adding enzyme BshC